MRAPVLVIAAMGILVGTLAGCISGKPPSDTYTDKSGKTSVLESDRELCERACNEEYSRCMETDSARGNSGVNGPAGMFGASAECRNDLGNCLPPCKGR
jgi:hypothetical protein